MLYNFTTRLFAVTYCHNNPPQVSGEHIGMLLLHGRVSYQQRPGEKKDEIDSQMNVETPLHKPPLFGNQSLHDRVGKNVVSLLFHCYFKLHKKIASRYDFTITTA